MRPSHRITDARTQTRTHRYSQTQTQTLSRRQDRGTDTQLQIQTWTHVDKTTHSSTDAHTNTDPAKHTRTHPGLQGCAHARLTPLDSPPLPPRGCRSPATVAGPCASPIRDGRTDHIHHACPPPPPIAVTNARTHFLSPRHTHTHTSNSPASLVRSYALSLTHSRTPIHAQSLTLTH